MWGFSVTFSVDKPQKEHGDNEFRKFREELSLKLRLGSARKREKKAVLFPSTELFVKPTGTRMLVLPVFVLADEARFTPSTPSSHTCRDCVRAFRDL